jgi:hypothetical protein
MNDSQLDNIDSSENLVKLSGREHFVAHWLLHREFPGNVNLAAAFHAMATMANSHHNRYTPSSRAVEEARKAYAELSKKPVAMYSLRGELLKVFDTTEQAATEVNINASNISSACYPGNPVNNVRGFLWRRFENEPLKEIEPYFNQNVKNSRRVHQYDLKGNYIRSFTSIREVHRTGVHRQAFTGRKNNIPFFAMDNWYVFSKEAPLANIQVKKKNTQRRKIHQIDPKTGELIKTWNSTREPQRELGISNISKVCKGQRKTMGGYIWKYAEEDYDLNLHEHQRELPRAKSIAVFKNGKQLGEFKSLRRAEKATGVRRAILSKILHSGDAYEGLVVKNL